LLTDRDEISDLERGPSIDALYKVSVHLAEVSDWLISKKSSPLKPLYQMNRIQKTLNEFCLFRGEDFKKNRPIRNKNCLWRPCLLMDRDEMSYIYSEPSIDASYQVSVHLAEGVSEEKIKM
jgi:hypothetical protein